MDDLPAFLQMFVRLFAVIAASAWLFDAPAERTPAEAEKETPAAHAPAQPAAGVQPCCPVADHAASPTATPQR